MVPKKSFHTIGLCTAKTRTLLPFVLGHRPSRAEFGDHMLLAVDVCRVAEVGQHLATSLGQSRWPRQ
ncbi:hypothetical protein AU381_05875 [Sinorhizobium glycinis]|uniref:Uncharacterized protein n=1 Tax=Sinorhizobium glycinis TaxID=1472378 RepID=A0A178Y3T5_9HYPH|nr:hypothetical protein AU381_05875 [Sinorhizobium glycinis]